MKKVRHSRWDYREVIKRNANKHKMRDFIHPQVLRQLDAADVEVVRWPKPAKYRTDSCGGNHDFIVIRESRHTWYRDYDEIGTVYRCADCKKKAYDWRKVEKLEKV